MQAFSISKALNHPKKVISISLQFQDVTNIFQHLPVFTNLKKLEINHCTLPSVLDSITWPPALEDLDLSNNDIAKITTTFPPDLKSLNLENNKISTWPKAIEHCKGLSVLKLGQNRLSKIPDGIGFFRNLKLLQLNDNCLKQLSKKLCTLQQLTHLYLANNKVERFNFSFIKCQKLVFVDWSDNSLAQFPRGLVQASNLANLNLSGNKITSIPKTVEQFEYLRQLDLSKNKLHTFPKSILNLKWLNSLDLSGNLIKRIPKTIINLQQLSTLKLKHNQIKALPISLFELKRLAELDIANNQLKKLPTRIATNNLNRINLANNQITSGIQTLYNCQNLQTLNLSNNPIKEIPRQFESHEKLSQLIIDNMEEDFKPASLLRLSNLNKLQANFLTASTIDFIIDLNVLSKKIDLDFKEKRMLLAVTKGIAPRISLARILEILNYGSEMIRFQLRNHLLQSDLKAPFEFLLLGQTNLPISELKKRLHVQNIQLHQQWHPGISHFILAEPPYMINLPKRIKRPLLSERQVLLFLHELEEKNFKAKLKAKYSMIQSMLERGKEELIIMLVNLLWGIGVDEQICSILKSKLEKYPSMQVEIRKLLMAYSNEKERFELLDSIK